MAITPSVPPTDYRQHLPTDVERKCAIALVKGICNDTLKEDNPGEFRPNPVCENPFWNQTKFFSQFEMERLLGFDIPGETANQLALEWAERGGQGEGELYARAILKKIFEMPARLYTTFDNGMVYDLPPVMKHKHGIEIEGERALLFAMDFYKELLWKDVEEEMDALIKDNPAAAKLELSLIENQLTKKRFQMVSALIEKNLDARAEEASQAQTESLQAAIVKETAKQVAQTLVPTKAKAAAPRKSLAKTRVEKPQTDQAPAQSS